MRQAIVPIASQTNQLVSSGANVSTRVLSSSRRSVITMLFPCPIDCWPEVNRDRSAYLATFHRKIGPFDRHEVPQRASVAAKDRNFLPTLTLRATLSCGHEDDILPGEDPAKAICPQCRQESMR